MRTTFQLLVFVVYVGALAWGGWYLLSGRMIEDRKAVVPTEQTNGIRGETAPGDADHPPPEHPEAGSET